MKKKLLVIIMVVGVLFSTLMAGCGGESGTASKTSSKVLNLNDYVVVEFEGVDGTACIDDIFIDCDKIMEDYADVFNNLKTTKGKDPFGTDATFFYAYDAKEESAEPVHYVSFTDDEKAKYILIETLVPKVRLVDQSIYEDGISNLKNGDKLEITWNERIGNVGDLEDITGLKIVYDKFDYIIDDLAGVEAVDPFENIWFNMSGKSGSAYSLGNGYVSIKTSQGYQDFGIKVEEPHNNGSLSNGDVVHVKLANYREDYWAEEYGVVCTRTEADVEIYGLNAYGDPNASNGEKTTINLNDYLIITYNGEYETATRLEVEIDYEAIFRDNLRSISENIPDDIMMGHTQPHFFVQDVFKWFTPYEVICVSNDYDVKGTYTDISGKFRNGDIVKLSWQVNSEGLELIAKAMNVEFVFSDVDYIISDLKPVVDFDPFENCNVTFSGSNGSGSAFGCVYPDPEDQDNVKLNIVSGNNGSLSNGDTIIISVEYFADNFVEYWGLHPTRTEMEVTVSGLK